MLAIVGQSGSGKSTLLHLMGALDTPSTGEICFEGRNMALMSADQKAAFRNKTLGFVFQFHHLLPEFSALENVAMPAIIGGAKQSAVMSRAREMLDRVGLSARMESKIATLSGGERQRVAIARAVFMRPRVLLADEPTGNLDEVTGAQVGALMNELNRELGMTLVVVTHNRELAAGMGLATRNCENHIGYAELAGADAEKYLATICHVDVVPEGNGWTEDPFKMEIRDGWMIGRGVADDKGPMVATLYALKFLKEEGVSLRYPIRALVGDNEETHMHDVDYYLANYPAPVFCFTPDAEFPVCNGEKGHFDGKLVSPVCNGVIKDFVGGVATNAVPDRASALVATDITKLRNAPNITLEPEGDGVRIRGWGKSGHAAMPEGTVNAIGLVVNYLLDNDLCNDAERAYLEAVKKLHDSTAGVGLGIDCADGPFGPLTIIGGKMSMVDGRMVQTMDSRYPTCTDGDTIAKQIRAAIGTGAELTDVGSAKPFYIEADTPAIKACIDTYNEVTGENATPFTMGGGTYARHFPYAVSFGPEHSDMVLPEFGGPMHGANEAAPIDKLLEALKIYIIALLRLEEIDF